MACQLRDQPKRSLIGAADEKLGQIDPGEMHHWPTGRGEFKSYARFLDALGEARSIRSIQTHAHSRSEAIRTMPPGAMTPPCLQETARRIGIAANDGNHFAVSDVHQLAE